MFSTSTARRIWKTAFLPVIDFVAIFFSAAFVYLVRYRWFEGNFIGTKQLPVSQYILISLGVGLLAIFIYAFLGLYEINQKLNFWQTSVRMIFGILLILLGIITFLFFNEYNQETLPQGVPISRFILATGGFFAIYFLGIGRLFFWGLERLVYSLGMGKINVALVCDPDGYIANWLLDRKEIGQIYHYSSLDTENADQIKSLLSTGQLDEIYLFSQQNSLEAELAIYAERYKASFVFSPGGFTQYEAFGFTPVTIGQRVFLEIKYTNLEGWWVVLKRIFDIIISFVAIIALSPVLLIISLIIKLDSKGPIFYGSERVGPNGKVFTLWKFRRFKAEFNTSERNPASQAALEYEQQLIQNNNLKPDDILYKIKDDPRMTRVGIILEKYSLDELPQLFNVLIGNMSLVGPRPHQPREVAKYAKHHFKVLNIKPGMTGLAQVNGRSDLSFEDEVIFDTFYVEKWSIWMDVSILFKTPLIVLFRPHQS